MGLRMAVKRLSAVEVDTARSHQHEFHAGRLRKELELPDHRVEGVLSCLILGPDGSQPVVDEASFTLYDAREGNRARSGEWHLYYASTQIPKLARAGDLLVLYRHESDLRAVVAPTGSTAERRLLQAMDLGDAAIETTFRFLDAPVPDASEAERVASQLALPLLDQGAYDITTHVVFERALEDGHLPPAREMAIAAADILRSKGLASTDPDDYLTAALGVETDLYFAIERHIHSARLEAMIATGPSVAAVIDFALAVQQSRRSRRGQSLQNHFAEVLRREHIPFSAQCRTEPGETPDFVMPGCDAYHDPTYPEARLRMVACKSTAKERWRQVLHEAVRVPEKYLLTLDPDLTHSTLQKMMHAAVFAFMPRDLLELHYGSAPDPIAPRSVGSLIELLRKIL